MFSVVLIFLVCLCLILIIFRRRKWAWTLGGVTSCLMVFTGGGFAPRLFLNHLQPENPLGNPEWQARNVIITLGGGTAKWPGKSNILMSSLIAQPRVHEAAKLYFSCMASKKVCMLLLSGGDPQKHGMSEAEVMASELMELGVPASHLILESKSNNTYKNAEFTFEILKTQNFDQTILVTSGGHIKRALLYFSKFGLFPTPAPADRMDAIITFIPVSINFLLTDLVLHEYTGMLLFHIYRIFES